MLFVLFMLCYCHYGEKKDFYYTVCEYVWRQIFCSDFRILSDEFFSLYVSPQHGDAILHSLADVTTRNAYELTELSVTS